MAANVQHYICSLLDRVNTPLATRVTDRRQTGRLKTERPLQYLRVIQLGMTEVARGTPTPSLLSREGT